MECGAAWVRGAAAWVREGCSLGAWGCSLDAWGCSLGAWGCSLGARGCRWARACVRGGLQREWRVRAAPHEERAPCGIEQHEDVVRVEVLGPRHDLHGRRRQQRRVGGEAGQRGGRREGEGSHKLGVWGRWEEEGGGWRGERGGGGG